MIFKTGCLRNGNRLVMGVVIRSSLNHIKLEFVKHEIIFVTINIYYKIYSKIFKRQFHLFQLYYNIYITFVNVYHFLHSRNFMVIKSILQISLSHRYFLNNGNVVLKLPDNIIDSSQGRRDARLRAGHWGIFRKRRRYDHAV